MLRKTGPVVARAIAGVPGVVDVRPGVVLAGDSWQVRVDRNAAALEGVEPAEVTRQVNAWMEGRVTTSVLRGPKMVAVRVWSAPQVRSRRQALLNLPLRAPDGHVFPLRRVAHIDVQEGAAQITREDLKQMVAVTGRITGRDMASAVADVRVPLDRPGVLPAGVEYRLGGLYEEQQAAMRTLTLVFGAAVALVFALLIYLYESFPVATCMLVPGLGAAAAGFIGLWLTGVELNITAMMGLTMVIGIVTEVSVFYVHGASLAPPGAGLARLEDAGRHRARPILMTALVASLALLPIALALGEGDALLRPMAITIIAGLIVELPLSLLILPGLLRLAGWPGDSAPVDGAPNA